MRQARSVKTIDFYTRQGCHLCEAALAVIEPIARECGAQLRLHDIDEDFALQERYGELVPVVNIDGERHAQWRVYESELRAALVE